VHIIHFNKEKKRALSWDSPVLATKAFLQGGNPIKQNSAKTALVPQVLPNSDHSHSHFL
jgi:hypothetical protein